MEKKAVKQFPDEIKQLFPFPNSSSSGASEGSRTLDFISTSIRARAVFKLRRKTRIETSKRYVVKNENMRTRERMEKRERETACKREREREREKEISGKPSSR